MADIGLEAGEGFVSILPDLNQARFSALLARQVEPALARLGQQFSSVGSKLTRGLTLPLLAGAGAAGRAAFQFEDAFTRIGALSNTTGAQVDQFRGQVLSLAGETAQAPQELADALFFLASAGLKAEDVFPTLEASAKASAVGLGDTADIARLTANALNAYADSGLTAADATDILVAAVREGTAEPTEFADALGRILPIASRAGVEFDQVTASLAGLSNIGLDVNEGVTAMRGVLQALVAPASQSAKALNELGISTDEMRAALAEGGLLQALQLLEERTGGNIDQLRAIIPNVRALTGELGLTGENAEKVASIFQNVAHSEGSLDQAFQETTEGPAFEFRQALAELQVSAVELGEKLLPIGKAIVDFASGVAGAFTGLPEPVQDLILKFGGLLIAIGPVLRLLGTAATVSSAFRTASIGTTTALTQQTVATTQAAEAMTLYVANANGAVVATREVGAAAATSKTGFAGLIAPGSLGGAIGKFTAFTGSALLAVQAFQSVNDLVHKSDDAARSWTEALQEGTTSVEELQQAVQNATAGGFGPIDSESDFLVTEAFVKTLQQLHDKSVQTTRDIFDRSEAQIRAIRIQEQYNAAQEDGLSLDEAVALQASVSTHANEEWTDALAASKNTSIEARAEVARYIAAVDRAGIVLSESQEATLRQMIADGDLTAATNLLTGALERNANAVAAVHPEFDIAGEKLDLYSLKSANAISAIDGTSVAVTQQVDALRTAASESSTFANLSGAAFKDWRENVIDEIDVVGDALETLPDKAKISARAILKSFEDQNKALANFIRNRDKILDESTRLSPQQTQAIQRFLAQLDPSNARDASVLAGVVSGTQKDLRELAKQVLEAERLENRAAHPDVDFSDSEARTIRAITDAQSEFNIELGTSAEKLIEARERNNDFKGTIDAFNAALQGPAKAAFAQYRGDLDTAARKAIEAKLKAEDYSGALVLLNQKLNNVDGDREVDVNVNISGEGALNLLAARLAELQGSHDINVALNTHGSGGHVDGFEKGALFKAASGFITKGQTILTGEGHKRTPFGPGAEVVTNDGVLPLDASHLEAIGRGIAAASHFLQPEVAPAFAGRQPEEATALPVPFESTAKHDLTVDSRGLVEALGAALAQHGGGGAKLSDEQLERLGASIGKAVAAHTHDVVMSDRKVGDAVDRAQQRRRRLGQ